VSGTVSNIEERVKESGIDSPAVIIIGKVVDESLMLKAVTEAKSHYLHA
jgi:siroheme synthase